MRRDAAAHDQDRSNFQDFTRRRIAAGYPFRRSWTRETARKPPSSSTATA
jgi:hypothetical protein